MKVELVHLADENSQLTLKTREKDTDRDRETEASCHLLEAEQEIVQCLLLQASTVLLTTHSPPSYSHWFTLSLSNSMTNVASCLLSTMAFDLVSFILVLVSSIKHFSLERTDLSYWVQKMSLIPGSASGGSKREL